jgi:glycosyltransferase involved in cell wall biosynthesis
MGISVDIMTLNMNRKWHPLWKEDSGKDGKATIFKQGAINPFFGIPNPLQNLFKINVLPKPGFMLKFRNYDVIHFIGEADLSFPIFSNFIKRPRLLQCVGIFRKGGIYKYYTSDRPLFGKIFKRIFTHIADKYVISSLEEKKLLIEMGVPPNKIVILPIGVDIELYRPDLTKKSETMLLFVGRIDRVKGLHILLQALPYLKTPVKLTIIGPPFDPEYMREIEEMSQAINRVGFHTVTMIGGLNSKELAPWYQKATLLVCPYIYETISNVIRESLACGTPVVSTGCHIMDDCFDGISIAQQDPKDIANVISNLLDEPQLCETLGKQGRSVIEKYFSWGSIAQDLVKLYEDTLKL